MTFQSKHEPRFIGGVRRFLPSEKSASLHLSYDQVQGPANRSAISTASWKLLSVKESQTRRQHAQPKSRNSRSLAVLSTSNRTICWGGAHSSHSASVMLPSPEMISLLRQVQPGLNMPLRLVCNLNSFASLKSATADRHARHLGPDTELRLAGVEEITGLNQIARMTVPCSVLAWCGACHWPERHTPGGITR